MFKAGFKRMSSGSIETRIARFLFSYHTTPQSTIRSTPAELLMKRNLRSCLDLLVPDLSNKVFQAQEQQKNIHDKKAQDHQFVVGDHVMARNHAEGPKWVRAQITKQSGPTSYKVTVNTTNQIWRRHQDAIRKYVPNDTSANTNIRASLSNSEFSPVPFSEQVDAQEETSNEIVTGRPRKVIRSPDRLTY